MDHASQSNYSRISVDEMDIDKMFDKTSSTEDQDSSMCQEQTEDHGGPLSPSDYTLDVDDDESTSLDVRN